MYGRFAIKTDGTLWAWGNNSRGELGQNSKTTYSSPRQIGSDTNWSAISAGGSPKGIKTDGTLWTWGNNTDGHLGLSQVTDQQHRSSPVQIPGTTWHRVHAQSSSIFAITRSS